MKNTDLSSSVPFPQNKVSLGAPAPENLWVVAMQQLNKFEVCYHPVSFLPFSEPARRALKRNCTFRGAVSFAPLPLPLCKYRSLVNMQSSVESEMQ